MTSLSSLLHTLYDAGAMQIGYGLRKYIFSAPRRDS